MTVKENLLLWQLEDILLNYVNEEEYGITLERKAQVEYLPILGKIEIYTDHKPPHFHIRTERLNLRFNIKTLEQIPTNTLSAKQRKNLEHWYYAEKGKEKIIGAWNERNPEEIIL